MPQFQFTVISFKALCITHAYNMPVLVFKGDGKAYSVDLKSQVYY